uniref:Uncharacterized protein n=1 Tax=Oryza meridionalis TaxID=40149 RepID=A0A0E0DE76_9ORYZ
MLLRLVRPLLRRHARGGGAADASSSPTSRTYASATGSNSGHLYLVLDDWKEGYSLHKLDLNANSGDGGDDPSPRRLPPPLLRLGFRTLGSWPHISALGSKIIFMGQRRPDQFRIDGVDGGDGDDDDKRRCFILVYDTATAAVDVSHHLPDDMHLVTSYDAVADAGKNRLYLLLPQFERSPSPEPPRRRPPWPGAPERGVDMEPYPYVEKVERVKAGTRLYLLLPDPGRRSRAAVGMPYLEKVEKVYPEEEEEKSAARGGRGRSYGGAGDDDEKDKYTLYRNRLTERWSWRTSTSPPPFSGGRRVTGHALHPDGRTIFVSVEKTHARRHPGGDEDDEEGTFSYDTERGGEWTRRRGWRLPFKGQAHYDRHLDAWVGIGASSSGAGGHPHLVACDVVELSDAADDPAPPPPPKWTACEETLTFLQGGAARERRVGGDPKLVPMGGGGGTFCVVESAPRAGLELGLGLLLGDGDKFELRVTVFHAKYGENGELLMTAAMAAAAAGGSEPWQSHTYALSRYLLNFHAPAFWMFHPFSYDSGDDGENEVETAYESGGDDGDEVETAYESSDDDDEVETSCSDDDEVETWYNSEVETSYDSDDEEVEASYNSDGEVETSYYSDDYYSSLKEKYLYFL